MSSNMLEQSLQTPQSEDLPRAPVGTEVGKAWRRWCELVSQRLEPQRRERRMLCDTIRRRPWHMRLIRLERFRRPGARLGQRSLFARIASLARLGRSTIASSHHRLAGKKGGWSQTPADGQYASLPLRAIANLTLTHERIVFS